MIPQKPIVRKYWVQRHAGVNIGSRATLALISGPELRWQDFVQFFSQGDLVHLENKMLLAIDL